MEFKFVWSSNLFGFLCGEGGFLGAKIYTAYFFVIVLDSS